ncbi:hypothetical protein N7488_006693 [Penicillium malachiteum]|nr:hypothetical protein N7488_006693 [Penicillium malachiteum]
MDTFMANLSSEVGVVLKENISIIVIMSMLSTAAYNALETVLITFDVVKRHRALYFLSMQVASWTFLVHALPAIVCSCYAANVEFFLNWMVRYGNSSGSCTLLAPAPRYS